MHTDQKVEEFAKDVSVGRVQLGEVFAKTRTLLQGVSVLRDQITEDHEKFTHAVSGVRGISDVVSSEMFYEKNSVGGSVVVRLKEASSKSAIEQNIRKLSSYVESITFDGNRMEVIWSLGME